MSACNITKEILSKALDYNPETGIFTWTKSGVGTKGGRKTVGSVAGWDKGGGYVSVHIFGKTYSAHRLAWLYVYGDWPNGFIDHINCNPSDNSIKNLRDVSRKQNIQNQRKPHKNSKSGLIGVTPHYGKWQACIGVDGISQHLGTFLTAEAAQAAYIERKRMVHALCTL